YGCQNGELVPSPPCLVYSMLRLKLKVLSMLGELSGHSTTPSPIYKISLGKAGVSADFCIG
ncbi:hypothetical protein ACQP3L_35790, partial [Escherichia coli]